MTQLINKKIEKTFGVKLLVPSKWLLNCISKYDFTVYVSPGLVSRMGLTHWSGVCAAMFHGTGPQPTRKHVQASWQIHMAIQLSLVVRWPFSITWMEIEGFTFEILGLMSLILSNITMEDIKFGINRGKGAAEGFCSLFASFIHNYSWSLNNMGLNFAVHLNVGYF